jgi:hypothetical protein
MSAIGRQQTGTNSKFIFLQTTSTAIPTPKKEFFLTRKNKEEEEKKKEKISLPINSSKIRWIVWQCTSRS